MLHTLNSLAGSAAVERLVLLVNHVLSSEPVATERLRAHAGRRLHAQLDAWPSALPALPTIAMRVTPAGLLESCASEMPFEPDLRVILDASNPALALSRALGGVRPSVKIVGDAALAGELEWLFENVRWDVQDDLARVLGQGPARELARVAGGLAAGVREAARGLNGLITRARGVPPEPPGQ